MKKIKMYGGYFAMVDDKDFDFLNKYTWSLSKHGDLVYARNCKLNVRMHRLIMGAKKSQIVDHIDGDGLNNTRSNLRFCNRSQNIANQRKKAGAASKYKGVSRSSRKNPIRWVTRLQKNKKTVFVGQFKSEKEAAIAYNSAAKKMFGEFARLNEVL